MAVAVSSVCKFGTYQTFRSSGVFAHPAGSTGLQSSGTSLKLSASLTFEEFTVKLVERFDSGKTKEDYKLHLRVRCQRPNEDFEGFADSVMKLVENA